MVDKPINLYEYEALAKELMPKPEWDFVEGGATDEITISRTRQALDSIMLRPRMLVNMDVLDLSTTVLGERIDFPLMMCPAAHPGPCRRGACDRQSGLCGRCRDDPQFWFQCCDGGRCRRGDS